MVKYKKVVYGIGAPIDTKLLWLDTSNPAQVSLKYYNSNSNEWKAIINPS